MNLRSGGWIVRQLNASQKGLKPGLRLLSELLLLHTQHRHHPFPGPLLFCSCLLHRVSLLRPGFVYLLAHLSWSVPYGASLASLGPTCLTSVPTSCCIACDLLSCGTFASRFRALVLLARFSSGGDLHRLGAPVACPVPHQPSRAPTRGIVPDGKPPRDDWLNVIDNNVPNVLVNNIAPPHFIQAQLEVSDPEIRVKQRCSLALLSQLLFQFFEQRRRRRQLHSLLLILLKICHHHFTHLCCLRDTCTNERRPIVAAHRYEGHTSPEHITGRCVSIVDQCVERKIS